ncbi:FHA domain-containing protein [Pseudomonadota bacterium]
MSNHSVLRLHSHENRPLSKDVMMNQTTEKLEIFTGDKLVNELPLNKAALLIGRDPQGDVQLMDPRISRRHARLTQISSGYYIEDCNSTNGTLLNGKPVQKHLFKPGDSLRIGDFELRYVSESGAKRAASRSSAVVQPITKNRRNKLQKGTLFFLQGSQEGEVKSLTKLLFTIGCPGASVAVIARRTHGTYLLHIGGELPEVNGVEIVNTVQLQDGDVIDVGKDKIKINLS